MPTGMNRVSDSHCKGSARFVPRHDYVVGFCGLDFARKIDLGSLGESLEAAFMSRPWAALIWSKYSWFACRLQGKRAERGEIDDFAFGIGPRMNDMVSPKEHATLGDKVCGHEERKAGSRNCRREANCEIWFVPIVNVMSAARLGRRPVSKEMRAEFRK